MGPQVRDPVLTRRELLAAGATAGVVWACGSGPPPLAGVPEEIQALHRESLVFDLHVDTLLWMRLVGYDLRRRHRPPFPAAAFAGQMDLPRAREGGLDGAVLGIVVSPDEERPEQIAPLKVLARVERGHGLPQTLATLELLAQAARTAPGELAFAKTGSEVRAAIAAGRFAAAVLFGVTPSDPVTLAGAAAVLAFVSLVACYLPARRASRVDPVVALAEE